MVAHFTDRPIYCRGCGRTRTVCGAMNTTWECSDCQRNERLGRSGGKTRRRRTVRYTRVIQGLGLVLFALVVGVFFGWSLSG